MSRSVLVLGANGFIGRRLITALGATGWVTPVAGVRRQPSSLGMAPTACRVVDATQVDSVRAAMQGITDVVNCVAGNEHSLVASAECTAQVAGELASGAVKPRVIHLSTMSVYGSAEGVVDESAPLRADLGAYCVAKIAAESAARRYPSTVILRPGCVFGPGSPQWSVRIARLLLTRRLGDLGPAGDGYCNLVHVDDVVQAVASALRSPATDGGIFNLCQPEPPTWNEFLVGYALALRAVPVQRIPGWRLRLEAKVLAPAFKIGEIVSQRMRIRTGRVPPPVPPSLLRLMRQRIQLDSSAAQRELGVRWKGLPEALQDTARWYLDSAANSRGSSPRAAL